MSLPRRTEARTPSIEDVIDSAVKYVRDLLLFADGMDTEALTELDRLVNTYAISMDEYDRQRIQDWLDRRAA